MHTIKILFAVLTAISIGTAQSVAISGKVTDTSGTTPIAGAVVMLEKGGQTATSRADGSFTIPGSTSINEGSVQTEPHCLSADIRNGLLFVNLHETSVVKITMYNLLGNALSSIEKTLDAGTHSLSLPDRGAGVYLYAIRSGDNTVLIKRPLIGTMSVGGSGFVKGSSSIELAKQTKTTAAYIDIISATKAGYLNYQVQIPSTTISGMLIKMVASAGNVTDADGNTYQSVAIGTQTWMAANLKTRKYRDGTAIPSFPGGDASWSSLTTPAYCWFNNDSITYGNTYGALYNWYAVNTGNLAPTGWHVPSNSEWNTLVTYLGGDSLAGGKLREAGTIHWAQPSTDTSNQTGFTALPGGCCGSWDGTFFDLIIVGFWWTSTADAGTAAIYRALYHDMTPFYSASIGRSSGFSVRCIKDN